MKQIICRGGCGKMLEQKHDADPKWYGQYSGQQCLSGICEDCLREEKKTK